MDIAARVYMLCLLHLRAPDPILIPWVPIDGSGNPVFTFTPPLSGAEQTTYTRLLNLGRSLVEGITPAEWAAIEPDISGLITFQNLATPTLAQTVLAVKAQSRILKAIIKN